MNTVTALEASPMERSLAKAWWLFLVTGIAWVLVAFVVLASTRARRP